jgi:hypothetical protein
MACDPFDAIRYATESLDKDLYRRASQNSLWMNAVPLGAFPEGVGVTQTTFTIGNSEPVSDNETWAAVTLSNNQILINGTGNACDIDYTAVDVGFTEQTYGPKQYGLKGPVICRDQFLYSHRIDQFMSAYLQELAKRAKRSWEFEMRRQYMYFSEKVVHGSVVNGPSTNISAITTIPNGELTQGELDELAAYLNESDAREPDSSGYVTLGPEGPLYTITIGQRASARIATNNANRLLDARAEVAGNNKELTLFQRIGAMRQIGNYRHAITTIPPRFNLVSGVLTSVPTFVMTATTEGMKASINPAWRTADYEGAIVMFQSVMTAEVVRPKTTAGGVAFNPSAGYMGEWQFVTGAFRLGLDCDDPLEKFGRHYAEFKYAPRPVFPDHGKTIIFKRCEDDIETAYCS